MLKILLILSKVIMKNIKKLKCEILLYIVIYILYIYKWNLVMLEQLHLKLEKVKAILLLQMKI